MQVVLLHVVEACEPISIQNAQCMQGDSRVMYACACVRTSAWLRARGCVCVCVCECLCFAFVCVRTVLTAKGGRVKQRPLCLFFYIFIVQGINYSLFLRLIRKPASLLVANLSPLTTADELRLRFEPFGKVLSATPTADPMDLTGTLCDGCAVVVFARVEDAKVCSIHVHAFMCCACMYASMRFEGPHPKCAAFLLMCKTCTCACMCTWYVELIFLTFRMQSAAEKVHGQPGYEDKPLQVLLRDE